jgi:hypothetical protein
LHALQRTQSHGGTARILLDLVVVGTFGAARQQREFRCMPGQFDR